MQSFHPPRRTLMGPGPSDINPRVTDALAKDTVLCDGDFIAGFDEIDEATLHSGGTRC